MSSTFLSSRPISVSDDVLIVLRDPQNDIVIERPMFMPDATSGGFLLDFCLYCYKIKLFSHHFLPLIAVVCPSSTPSVLSGINRIQRWSQSKPLYLVFAALSMSIYSVWTQEQRCQAIYPSLFATHGSGLPLRNSLSAFRHKQTFPPAHDSDRFQRLLYRSLHYFVKEIEHIFAIYFPSQLYTSH